MAAQAITAKISVASLASSQASSKMPRRSGYVSRPQFSGLRRMDVFQKAEKDLLSCPGHSQKSGVTMAGTGKFFVGGNWKANGTKESIATLVQQLNAADIDSSADVAISPPFIYLDQVLRTVRKDIIVAAQNCWVGKTGAFTGEVCAEQLKSIGVNWVILGHSERRHVIGESIEFVGKKVEYALGQGLSVIACIGEKLDEREAGKTLEVCFAQLAAIHDHIPSWSNIVIAYEPVWAIGTGKVASPDQAQEVHAAVRKWLADTVDADTASRTRIIYGGSVTATNSGELAKEEDIDGFLVGGASLKGPDFSTIVNSVQYKKVKV